MLLTLMGNLGMFGVPGPPTPTPVATAGGHGRDISNYDNNEILLKELRDRDKIYNEEALIILVSAWLTDKNNN